MRVRHTIAAIVLVLAALAGASGTATASNITGTYGSRGYTWLARYYDMSAGFEVVTSNYCTLAEKDALARIRSSTAGTAEFAGRWPSGLQVIRSDACDGLVNAYVDIALSYSDFCATHACGTYGGENHSILAPSSWCSIWGARYPCGSHPSVVHLNKPKYLNTASAGRQRLIMHETGHSQGLDHHCAGDSIMNDGSSGCNGGRWLDVMGYRPTDRAGIRNVFPCWRCP